MNIDNIILTQVKSAPTAMQRAQTAAASEKAGIVFYRFQGRPIPTTRPWCLAREGHVFHIEEIREWGRQAAAGVGWDGMVEGTNEQTIMTYLGGWYGNRSACRHVLIPVLPSRVPAEDMARIRAKGLLDISAISRDVSGPVVRNTEAALSDIRKAWSELTEGYRSAEIKQEGMLADFTSRVEPKLSKEEAAALYDYTGILYKKINGRLRGKVTIDSYDSMIARIRSALSAHPLSEEIVVFRGVGSGDTAKRLAELATRSAVGSEFSSRGFSSASLDAGTDFIKDSTTVLRMLAPKGTRAIYLEKITKNKGEYELLFDDDAKFRILGTEEVRGVTYIDVEAIS